MEYERINTSTAISDSNSNPPAIPMRAKSCTCKNDLNRRLLLPIIVAKLAVCLGALTLLWQSLFHPAQLTQGLCHLGVPCTLVLPGFLLFFVNTPDPGKVLADSSIHLLALHKEVTAKIKTHNLVMAENLAMLNDTLSSLANDATSSDGKIDIEAFKSALLLGLKNGTTTASWHRGRAGAKHHHENGTNIANSTNVTNITNIANNTNVTNTIIGAFPTILHNIETMYTEFENMTMFMVDVDRRLLLITQNLYFLHPVRQKQRFSEINGLVGVPPDF